jgi:hypothetical protein
MYKSELTGLAIALQFKNLKIVLESSIRNWWHASEPLSRVKYTQYSKYTSELEGLNIESGKINRK